MMTNPGKFAPSQDFERACEGLRAMVAYGMSFADIGRHCGMSRGSNNLYRQIVNGTAKAMSIANAAKLIDGYDRFRARPPEVIPPNRAHQPTEDACAFSFSPRTQRGKRTPAEATEGGRRDPTTGHDPATPGGIITTAGEADRTTTDGAGRTGSMTTTKRKPRQKPMADLLGNLHDRADRLRDDIRRDLLPRYDPGDMDATQIADLAEGLAEMIEAVRNIADTAESLANCLKVERIIHDGYDPQKATE